MYEDALHFANIALKFDGLHMKTLFRKAKALGFLFAFREAIYIFKKLGMKNEVKNVEMLKMQRNGEYENIIDLKNLDNLNFENLINYIEGLKI